jgi:hypothetical protein
MIDCPCGKQKIPADTKICAYCGQLILRMNATRRINASDEDDLTPRWGTARLTGKMTLVLQVRDVDQRFRFDPGEIQQITLGRKDPDTGESPEVDLSVANAIDLGVSRRHASIVRKDTASLVIVDKGSPNGTYLNGTRLIPNQPRILRDGDELRLGRLVLHVFFERA